jgi:hypothetical protein
MSDLDAPTRFRKRNSFQLPALRGGRLPIAALIGASQALYLRAIERTLPPDDPRRKPSLAIVNWNPEGGAS